MSNTNLTYENIVSANVLFNQNIDRWRFLYRSYVGGDEYRKAGYLTRYALETDKEYQARCLETPLDNHCASIISVYNSFLFRECPDREFGGLEMLPELEDFLKDADLDGRSLDAFMREVNTWSNVFGTCWIIMSKPNINAVTRADELAAGIRPYVSILTPLVVTDWKFERATNGRYELTYFKYVEDVNGSVQTVREWTPTEIITSIVDTETERAEFRRTVTIRGTGIHAIYTCHYSNHIIHWIIALCQFILIGAAGKNCRCQSCHC